MHTLALFSTKENTHHKNIKHKTSNKHTKSWTITNGPVWKKLLQVVFRYIDMRLGQHST